MRQTNSMFINGKIDQLQYANDVYNWKEVEQIRHEILRYKKKIDEINNDKQKKLPPLLDKKIEQLLYKKEIPLSCKECKITCGEMLEYGEPACKRRIEKWIKSTRQTF